MEADPDNELIASISPDVMKCLVRSGFFEKLDDLLCPRDHSHQREGCRGDYKLSESVLLASEFERTDLDDIFGVLRSKGGCCDCEILYNVAESSRLKAEYWRSRAEGLAARREFREQHLVFSAAAARSTRPDQRESDRRLGVAKTHRLLHRFAWPEPTGVPGGRQSA
jgi:hypothetical protein